MKRFKAGLLHFFTFFGGLYFFLEFILPKQIGSFQFGYYHEQILKGIQVVGVMAIGLGIISIARVHGGNVLRRRPGAVNSVVLLAGFISMIVFQLGMMRDDLRLAALKKGFEADRKFLSITVSEQNHQRLAKLEEHFAALEKKSAEDLPAPAERPAAFAGARTAFSALDASLDKKPAEDAAEVQAALQAINGIAEVLQRQYGEKNEVSVWKQGNDLFENGLFVPLGSAMFALLAFYIATAAYRSFRIRSVESSLLMLAAVIVMLGQIPQGSLYISSSLPAIRLWLLKNISTPAFRAIFFGASIAGLAMAIRIWLSLEKSPLAGDDA